MLTVYLFCLFVLAYAYLFTPSKQAIAPVTASETLQPSPAVRSSEVSTDESDSQAIAPQAAPGPVSNAPDTTPAQAMAIAFLPDLAVEVVTVPTPATVPSSHELRKLCQSAGVKWRNVHGQGKHLTKPEMMQALGLK